MADFVPACNSQPGLEFMKLMGSGSGDGFSVWPNFSQYALMCVWKSESEANTFFSQSTHFKNYVKNTTSFQTIYLKSTMSHGLWNGIEPFKADPNLNKEDHVVAILTRATIRWKDMIRFWKDVPAVSKSLADSPIPPLFAAGVGELPFRYQATFSIWPNSKAMKAFAYNTKAHANMVTKTRQVGWYSEELFARFVPYKTEGDRLINLDTYL